MLAELKKIAKFEGYSDDAEEEFKSLEAKFNHNIDKDLQTFRKEISAQLEQEIVQRYYFQKGEIQKSLQYDEIVAKANEILSDKTLYKKTLNIK